MKPVRKVLFVYPGFSRHSDHHPELRQWVPMNEYLGSPSLGIASVAAATPAGIAVEHRDDRLAPADHDSDADVVALSFFTPAATRGLELARAFKAMGKTVVAGGIFPTMMPHLVEPHVDAVVVGEGEEVWPRLLEDLAEGRLRMRYVAAPADVTRLPVPRTDLYFGVESPGVFEPDDYPLQLSRGCPMSCVACALPTSMHDHVRLLPMAHVTAQLERLESAGKRACLTEDTSWFPGAPRNQLVALADLLERTGRVASISYVGISMPMILATPLSLLQRLQRVGVGMFYLVGGFDPITTRAFTGTDAKALDRAHHAIRKAQDAGIDPYTSFLVGNDGDDDGTADRMLDFADRARISKAEFAIFTPYPGTPAWRSLSAQGRILSTDFSRYNDANVVFRPALMSPETLQQQYLDLWRGFYATRGHLRQLSVAERTIQF